MPTPKSAMPLTTLTYQTDPTTLMKLSPAGLAMTWEEVVPVLMEVGRGMVMTGKAWLSAICCWANGARSVGGCARAVSCGVGVTDGVAFRVSVGCGVEQGVLVGVGVKGFGVPDPRDTNINAE